CAGSPSRRLAADHPSAVGVNPDASLFLSAAPDSGGTGWLASADPAGSARSVDPHPAGSGGGLARRRPRRSRPGRGHNSGRRSPGGGTARTGTDGPRPDRPAHRRRPGVDERRHWQDTRPAFVPDTMWGTASRSNCQVALGAVLARDPRRLPAGCRGSRCLTYLRPGAAETASALGRTSRGNRHLLPRRACHGRALTGAIAAIRARPWQARLPLTGLHRRIAAHRNNRQQPPHILDGLVAVHRTAPPPLPDQAGPVQGTHTFWTVSCPD